MSYQSVFYCLLISLVAGSEGFTPANYPIQRVQQCGVNVVLDESFHSTLQVIQEQLSYLDCQDAYDKNRTTSGVYTINPDGKNVFQVYCDMDTDGGGWTVFQRRMDGSVDFYRYWVDYEEGFGSLAGEYWLGLRDMHRLTASAAQELRVDLEDFDNQTAYAYYSTFNLTGAADMYRLTVSGYNGTAGDSLEWHSGQQFSTRDRGNTGCAISFKGAWWYHGCHTSNLNGRYHGGVHQTYADGVNWEKWRGFNYSLKRAEMKMRRK